MKRFIDWCRSCPFGYVFPRLFDMFWWFSVFALGSLFGSMLSLHYLADFGLIPFVI